MSKIFDIRIFDHPVELEKCRIEQVLCKGQSLSDIKRQFAPKFDVVIMLDGRQVRDEDFKSIIVSPGCTIDIIPAIGVVWYWAAITWIFTKIWAALPMMLISFGISYLGGMLMNQDIKQPDDNNRKDSQNFGWDPHTTFQEGLPRGRNYGRNMHTGNIVARWTDVAESGSEKLYLIVDHGDGPTGGIEEDKVYLNDQPSDNFDVTIQERIGTMDQTVMTGFEQHKNEFRPALDITNTGGPVVFTTPDNDFDDIEFTIEFPRGLFRYNKEGERGKNKIEIKMEIREVGGEWTTLFENEIEGKSMSPIYQAFTVSELPTLESLGWDEWHEPPDTFVIERGKQYELRFTKLSNDHPQRGDDVKLRSVRQVYDVAFTRPGKALVGIIATGTANLSGDLNIKVVRKDRLVRVYDGESWSIEWSRNRAWVDLDILTQPVIGGNGDTEAYYVDRYEGYDPSKVDLAFFYEWAELCDDQVTDGAGGTEARMTCDFLGDYETDMWSLAHEIAQIGRAYLYWFGNQLTGWLDAAVDAPFDMVTMQNMVAGSWKNAGPVHGEKAGSAEVYYRDSQEFYKRKNLPCPNEDAGVYKRIVKIEGIGITTKTLATRVGNHSMQRNMLIWNKNKCTMYKDASRYKPGYVLRIQRDEPDWGKSYRVVDVVDTDTVQLDRSITATPGDNLYVRQYNSETDDIETALYEVDSADGDEVTVTTEWDIEPIKDNIIAIGTTVLRRITKMKVRQDNYYDLEVETYDTDLFTSDSTEPYNPNPDYHWPAGGDAADKPITRRDVMDILENFMPGAPNIDIPWLSNITWEGDEIDTVEWSATDSDESLYFRYKGVTYEITADSTTDEFIFWDPEYTTMFRSTNSATVLYAALLAGGWYVCRNIAGVAYPSVPIQSLWAGVIQAGTIFAELIATAAIETEKINGHAVTYPVSAYTASAIATDYHWTEIQDVNIEYAGYGNVLIIMSEVHGLRRRYFRIQRTIGEGEPETIWSSTELVNATMPFSFMFVDTGLTSEDAGTVNYSFQNKNNVDNGTCCDRSLFVNEFKR